MSREGGDVRVGFLKLTSQAAHLGWKTKRCRGHPPHHPKPPPEPRSPAVCSIQAPRLQGHVKVHSQRSLVSRAQAKQKDPDPTS